MKKFVIVALLGLGGRLFAQAQPHLLMIQGEPGKFYVEHIVDARENWYSVGRMYNISPKEIAPYNETAITRPLEIGQRLKIPLTSSNFSQNGLRAEGETLVPLYHTIEPREWLYHIATTYSKVSVQTLEKWNHITGDQAKAGMQLIVAYLKVKTSQSPLAGGNGPTAAPAAVAGTSIKKDTLKAGMHKDSSRATVAASQPSVSKVPPGAQVTTEKNPAIPAVAAETKPSDQAIPAGAAGVHDSQTAAPGYPGGGFFSADFVAESKSLSGQAATFKSTSGWQDGKYYALMNNVPVGTILKVTNPATNRTVYAKVLGQLPDMKESAGLLIRISNAAAADLGAAESKFKVDLKY